MTQQFRRRGEIASSVLAPAARQNDKAGPFSSEAIDKSGLAGLLGLMLPDAKLGPKTPTVDVLKEFIGKAILGIPLF